MIILGIDPGYAIVGFGAIEFHNQKSKMLRYGAIRTEAHIPAPERLCTIYDDLNKLLDMIKPDAVAVEELFFNTNSKTAIMVGQARGVIILACSKRNIPTFEYTPLQVKQAVVGYGRAEKQQVMELTKTILGLSAVPKPDDAADALAIALCHAHSSTSVMINKLL
ncbi:MAG: crossover junction endodeoxyribonuclease RuvC [Clostridiales bacterium]|nr:crossover junction endodeoxyribonuclease RuvC [Clostridiales bacterium]